MALKDYRAKRDFSRTREPAGGVKSRAKPRDFRPFVVQKHAARRLHYDFRLEMGGVLKSWAVPKGFPTRKGDRRLAVEVEDHPVEYADFEGTIPEGNYGAGTVMVWDRGEYKAYGDDPEGSWAAGKLHLELSGKKLKGEWTLVRLKDSDSRPADKPQWLLLKTGEDAREFTDAEENKSALTGRTLEEIASENRRQWQSNRQPQVADKPTSRKAARELRAVARRSTGKRAKEKGGLPELKGLPARKSTFVPPMKAVLSRELPSGPKWLFEIKWDGIRALAVKSGDRVVLYSRSEKEMTAEFPALVKAVLELPVREAVLDGEVVALDPEGRPSFQLLQSRRNTAKPAPQFFYVFDIVALEGRDTSGLPLTERKKLVERILNGAPDGLRFSGAIEADSNEVLSAIKKSGLEGLMAKLRDSPYEIGRRSGAWVKVKWGNEQEFVIGGYTPPSGARSYFGALLVGYYLDKKLIFAGKVGTGFSFKSLHSLHLRFQSLIISECPFVNLRTRRTGAYAGGLSASEMRRCTWVKPQLVGQVRFAEWTRDGYLRQPAFLGLREDKEASEVVREV